MAPSITGETVSIPARRSGRATPAFAAFAPCPARAVVVLHEILGPQPEIERVVRRFAEHGYAAAAPDFFSHAPRPICIARTLRAIATGQGDPIDQVEDTRGWLLEQTGLGADHIGVIGFCLGGGFALAVGRGFAAVSTNYGPIPPASVLAGSGPILGCYGGKDRVFRGAGATLAGRLRSLGVPHEVHVFPEVGHSFLTDGDHWEAALSKPFLAIEYNAEVAERSWTKIMSFFDRELGQ